MRKVLDRMAIETEAEERRERLAEEDQRREVFARAVAAYIAHFYQRTEAK